MTDSIWESVIDSLSNEKDYYKKQVSKLEKVIEAQKQEAIIVQCGLDFLEAQELEKEIRNQNQEAKIKKLFGGSVEEIIRLNRFLDSEEN